jgi:carbohydrate kinase (thermoresistant glucokinase family)
MTPGRAARAIVLMGVAGAGKTTVGERLAESLGWRFVDADAFHPPENVARMRRGEGLTDAHRWPWLAALRAHLRESLARGDHVVLACSALRRAYREALVPPELAADVRLVYLRVPRDELSRRLLARTDHFAPPELLDSQLATLEPPGDDEDVTTVDAGGGVEDVVAAVLERMTESA